MPVKRRPNAVVLANHASLGTVSVYREVRRLLRVEEVPSDRDPVAEERYVDEVAAEQDPDADDADLFGIHLGPAGDRSETVEPGDEPEPERQRRPTKTLSERLATAAADRDNAEPPAEEGRPET